MSLEFKSCGVEFEAAFTYVFLLLLLSQMSSERLCNMETESSILW